MKKEHKPCRDPSLQRQPLVILSKAENLVGVSFEDDSGRAHDGNRRINSIDIAV